MIRILIAILLVLFGMGIERNVRRARLKLCTKQIMPTHEFNIRMFYDMPDSEPVSPNHISAYFHFKLLECLKEKAKDE